MILNWKVWHNLSGRCSKTGFMPESNWQRGWKNSGEQTPLFLQFRGGVPVAFPIAERLNSVLDVLIVRKIPIPYNPEAGFGAVTSDGTIVLNERLVR